jgi:hypothetical protein
MNSKNECKIFFTELQGEINLLNQMLETFKKSSIPTKVSIYINLVSNGVRFRNHLQHILEQCNKKKYQGWFENRSKDDNIIKFFINERNRLEHESYPKFNSTLFIQNLSLPKDLLQYGPMPNNAVGSFIDGIGVGWLIKQSDETTIKMYIPLPEEKMKINIIPTALPTELTGKTIEELLTYFVNYLIKAFEDIKKDFN